MRLLIDHMSSFCLVQQVMTIFFLLPILTSAWYPYPACVLHHSEINGEPLFIDIKHHFKDGALLQSCQPDCSNTDRFAVVDIDACSLVCSRHPDCRGWIYKEFATPSGDGLCRLKKTFESREPSNGFEAGDNTCTVSAWPDCIEQDVNVKNVCHHRNIFSIL